jgi:hypothetical protein
MRASTEQLEIASLTERHFDAPHVITSGSLALSGQRTSRKTRFLKIKNFQTLFYAFLSVLLHLLPRKNTKMQAPVLVMSKMTQKM